MLPLHHATGAETRGNGMKLLKRESHGQLRSNFLGYRAVSVWNGLPEDTVKASTVNSFRGHFGRFCEINRFSTDWKVPGVQDVKTAGNRGS
jgi:hypothetical protein